MRYGEFGRGLGDPSRGGARAGGGSPHATAADSGPGAGASIAASNGPEVISFPRALALVSGQNPQIAFANEQINEAFAQLQGGESPLAALDSSRDQLPKP